MSRRKNILELNEQRVSNIEAPGVNNTNASYSCLTSNPMNIKI